MSRFEYERALLRSELPSGVRLVALVLATWADANSGLIPAKFTPSLSTLADATDLDRRTVIRHLDVLEAAQWIARGRPDPVKARTEHQRSRYRLTVPSGTTPPASGTTPPGLVASGDMASGTTPPKTTKTTDPTREGRTKMPENYTTAQVDEVLDLIAGDFEDPAAALAHWLKRRDISGTPIRNLAAFARSLGHTELVKQIKEARPHNTTKPPCSTCDGSGWIYDETNDPVTSTKCPAHRPGPVSGTPSESLRTGAR